MGRSLLVLLLAAAIGWLVLRLSRTLGQILPGKSPKRAAPEEKQKIIDAEFEDVTKEDTTEV